MRTLGSHQARSSRGALATLLLAILVLGAFMVCSLAMDIAHVTLVRGELHSATDAGALAGAHSLATNNTLTTADVSNASLHAYNVTASNRADNIAVSNSAPDTSVSVSVNATSMPRTCTVTAVRVVPNTFARLFGSNVETLSTTSVAQAFQGVTTLAEGQAWNMAVSLDYAPERGPQAGLALQDYIGGTAANTPFTIVMNPQNAKNAGWLREWDGMNTSPLTFGQTTGTINGVQATEIQKIHVGDTLVLPLILGGPPFNDSRTIMGIVAFQVTEIKFPLQITGYIKDPIIVRGIPGTPILPVSNQANQFLTQHSPWKVTLIQ